MSEDDSITQEKPFFVEVAKQGRAVCKKCKQKCVQGDLRIAKLIPNPFGSGKMKTWHHVSCIFEVFLKQRQTTKRIEGPHDVDGWDLLSEDDKNDILKKIKNCNTAFEAKLNNKNGKKSKTSKGKPQPTLNNEDSLSVSSDCTVKDGIHKDNCFREFRTIVANVSSVRSSSEKISIFREIFTKGSDGTGFKGDIMIWCKLLLPAVIKRVFNVQTKQLVKIFSKIFHVAEETILEHLDQSDVGQTIQHFFEQCKKRKPANKSTLTIHEVDDFLEKLTNLTKEDDYFNHFKTFIKRCTANDLKVVVRLIKHDLRMNAGAKHVFEGLHPDAYQLFQSCRDIKTVINTCWGANIKKEKSPSEILLNPKTIKRSPKRKITTDSHTNPKKINHEDIKSKCLETKDADALIETATLDNVKKEEPKIADSQSCQTEVGLKWLNERRKSVPNYFENIKLYLEDGVTERHAEWVRYFIAYGGTVLKPNEYEDATHVLHLKDTISEPSIKCPSGARHVIVEWIKDSVTRENLQDYRPYTVRWRPDHKT